MHWPFINLKAWLHNKQVPAELCWIHGWVFVGTKYEPLELDPSEEELEELLVVVVVVVELDNPDPEPEPDPREAAELLEPWEYKKYPPCCWPCWEACWAASAAAWAAWAARSWDPVVVYVVVVVCL